MSIWSERGLPVLTLGLDRGESGYAAYAETAQGHAHLVLHGLASALAQAGGSASGITATYLQKVLSESFAGPQGEGFPGFSRNAAGAAIWLDFRAPSGMLPALPWETAFRQFLGISVFRLPQHEILPLADRRSLSASVYVDDPGSYEMAGQVKELLASIASCTRRNEINVFGDKHVTKGLGSRWRWLGRISYGKRYAAITHPLSTDASWADHIQSVRPAAPIDLLIVIAPAIVVDRRPSLLMSSGADRRRRPVSPEEIAQCATDLGAWSIGVVGTGKDGANSGRMLTHELAAARPGPVVAAPLPGDLGLMYRRLLARKADPAHRFFPATEAASAYVHPDGPDALAPGIEPTAYDPDRRRRLHEVLDTATLGAATAAAAIPRWLASNQRVLEQFAEPLLHGQLPDELGNERRIGYQTGMETVSSILRNSYKQGRRHGR